MKVYLLDMMVSEFTPNLDLSVSKSVTIVDNIANKVECEGLKASVLAAAGIENGPEIDAVCLSVEKAAP
ncbi:hypothetical protein ACMGDM_11505 [Sphingomonas sp. DT-51]|uniref:hypothetical protein n=1 Tax=Sphingomonas sp. DT-51 TaxID=3396165 RepID=UPI003F1A41B5